MSINIVEFLDRLIDAPTWGADRITSPHSLPMEWRVEYEERAAILEYDGELPRWRAEAQAMQEILARMGRNGPCSD